MVLYGCTDNVKNVDWPEYLGGVDRNHYSSLDQINQKNVDQLKIAWEYHTGDSGEVQMNPIIVDGILYGVSAVNRIFALDAATGEEIWSFLAEGTAKENKRGVAYWEDGNDKRILYTYASWLYALNARTGKPIQSFGQSGKTSLRSGLEGISEKKYVISTTPGTIFKDLIIMPLRLQENETAALGHIQAFNIRTGKLAWVFHTIPYPGEFGHETWPANAYKNSNVGAANNWAGMALDRDRGILYVPTGSATDDFYGGFRKGVNLFANTLLALDASTGNRIWHYQIVHHDVLDMDLPAPPNLITLRIDGKEVDAVAQITKMGRVFVFDRETGAPLYHVDEVPAPPSELVGEKTWPTQPVPRLPVPFSRQSFTEAELNPFSRDRDSILQTYRKARKGFYVPIGETPTIVFPGLDAGSWGGAAVNPDGILYVNANEIPWILSMSRRMADHDLEQFSPGKRLYISNCSGCHGKNMNGNSASGYPSLTSARYRLKKGDVTTLISSGKRMMPGFPSLTAIQKQAIVSYLYGDEKTETTTEVASTEKADSAMPYQFDGYYKFLDSEGYPAINPPWGTLTAIDLNTGNQVWRKTLGNLEELKSKFQKPTGTENFGGPVITAGGVLFIAATKDGKFRAFNMKTGDLLWETTLPAAAFATPSTYRVGGKQYIVLACGGGKLGTKKGDSYLAFALK